jgi:tRNA pseudouridine38-40 synthase
MPTYRMTVEYDGGPFRGWQIQPGQPTVQAALERVLQTVLREPVGIVGSGRTDTGVHARGQVAHFVTEQPIDAYRLQRSFAGLLPDAVAVLSVEEAAADFHARYSARERRYRYRVACGPRALDRHLRWSLRPPLTPDDFSRMNQAAAYLVGRHDFDSFCRTQSATVNRVCTVVHARWTPEERRGDWTFEIAADRFLHGMVRAIVGTLVAVGHGKRAPDDLPAILEQRDRRAAGEAAPPHGLSLEQVTYADDVGAP